MKECCEFQSEEGCKGCKYRMFCEDCPIESAEEQSEEDLDEFVKTLLKKLGWID